MKVKKTMYIVIATVIGIIITMTACERKSTVYDSPNSPNEDLFGKIVVWSENDSLNSLKFSGGNFKKLYPNVQIDYVNVDGDKLYSKIISGFASDSGLPDMFSIKDDSIQMFVNKFPDGFLDISSTINPIKSKFIDSKIPQCSINGKFFAIPWDTDPTAVFYRKDIFEKANIFAEDIKTWQDYIKAGKVILTSTEGTTKMLPLDVKNDDMIFREMLNQLNTSYFDKNGKVALNSKNSIRAMEIVCKMNEEGLIYNTEGLEALKDSIKNGEVATLPYGSALARIIMEAAPEQTGKWGVMKLPTFEPGGSNVAAASGSSIMITKASKNAKVALKFAEFAMTDNDSLVDSFSKYGILPAYTPFYDTINFDRGVSFFGNQKIWVLFSNIAKDSSQINFTEKFSETKNKLIKTQCDILSNHLNVQSAMDALQTELYNAQNK